ncbi:MAG: ribosome small subunit-dependent GTPase A, partial [Candidatus Eisenbacteria sp.]|nr:ribosome small subunit-dependent GTPase A [Candidatus Eisenbacteria bacterium]
KVDLVEKSAELDPLATYRAIGYPVFQTSAIRGDGLSELHAFLRGKSSLIIGPSGVGKSTLLNRLIPGIELRTAAVSAATRRGVHVTSRIEYLELPEGGVVLDSPGIRSIQPWTSPQELAWHFPEMRRLIGSCRFRDCLHRGEPGCAILRAITEGVIDAARHKSYLRILAGLIAEGPGASVRPRSEGK